MDHFEDPFLNEAPLNINFDEEATKFFDPEAAQEADFLHPQQPVEESIYTDDPVRVYLREMGAVPLLTREGEVNLARRMERGKLRMQKAISRSAVVQIAILDLAENMRKGSVELEQVVDMGETEEGAPADTRRREELQLFFTEIQENHKKQQQLAEKVEATPWPPRSRAANCWASWLVPVWKHPFLFAALPFYFASGKILQKKSNRPSKNSAIWTAN